MRTVRPAPPFCRPSLSLACLPSCLPAVSLPPSLPPSCNRYWLPSLPPSRLDPLAVSVFGGVWGFYSDDSGCGGWLCFSRPLLSTVYAAGLLRAGWLAGCTAQYGTAQNVLAYVGRQAGSRAEGVCVCDGQSASYGTPHSIHSRIHAFLHPIESIESMCLFTY